MKDISVAILVDGAFFIKRYELIYGGLSNKTPKQVVDELYNLCLKHLNKEEYLYRILFYDCVPLDKKIHNPISKKVVDFSKTPQAIFRLSMFEELKKKRKVALRLGYLKDKTWVIKPILTKKILDNPTAKIIITEKDILYDIRQKGVDIKIGIDISSLAYKRLVQKIILIAGDCDFVPALKLARREGIDIVLDPMWNNLDPQLFEHIDGLNSTCNKPPRRAKKTTTSILAVKPATPITP